jgi:hypothetical protein
VNNQLLTAINSLVGSGKTTVYCGLAGGTANALTLTASPAITSYTTGSISYIFIAQNANTGAATASISGLNAENIFKEGPTGPVALSGGEIQPGNICVLKFDGAHFQLAATEFGTAAMKNVGSTVLDPGTGTLETSSPFVGGTSAISGSTRTFAATDRGQVVRRSNAGSAMTDILPGTGAVLASGWWTEIINSDSTATIAITAGTGATIDGVTSYLLAPGASATIGSDGVNYWSGKGFGASVTAKNTWVPAQTGNVATLSYASTVTVDLTAANNFILSLTGNVTLANPSTMIPGTSGFITLVQDATGSRLASFGSYWRFGVTGTPSLSTAANARDLLVWYVADSTHIVASLVKGWQ